MVAARGRPAPRGAGQLGEEALPSACRQFPRIATALDEWERVATVVPAGHPRPATPRTEVEALGVARVEHLVEEGWAGLGRPVGRWLAAKAFASSLALQGEGLRTSVLDCDLLKEAFRRSSTSPTPKPSRAG